MLRYRSILVENLRPGKTKDIQVTVTGNLNGDSIVVNKIELQ